VHLQSNYMQFRRSRNCFRGGSDSESVQDHSHKENQLNMLLSQEAVVIAGSQKTLRCRFRV
jgi:hypothetical protein